MGRNVKLGQYVALHRGQGIKRPITQIGKLIQRLKAVKKYHFLFGVFGARRYFRKRVNSYFYVLGRLQAAVLIFKFFFGFFYPIHFRPFPNIVAGVEQAAFLLDINRIM